MSNFEQPDLPNFEIPTVNQADSAESDEAISPLLEYTFYRQGPGSDELPIFAINAEDSSVAYAAYVADCENNSQTPISRSDLRISGVKPEKKN
jgi:hypothetical protein